MEKSFCTEHLKACSQEGKECLERTQWTGNRGRVGPTFCWSCRSPETGELGLGRIRVSGRSREQVKQGVPAQGRVRIGWWSVPGLAVNSPCPGKLFSPEQTGMVSHPMQELFKTEIKKECSSQRGFQQSLIHLLSLLSHFEPWKAKIWPCLEKGLSPQFYQYIWNAAQEIQSFSLSYSGLCVVRKVCVNLEVCDTCPRLYPRCSEPKVNAVGLRVRSGERYRSRDRTSRGRGDRCVCECWGRILGHPLPQCLLCSEKPSSQVMPEVPGS